MRKHWSPRRNVRCCADDSRRNAGQGGHVIPFHLARSLRSVIALLVATTLLCLAVARVSAQASPADDTRASVVVLDFNVAALRDAASWAPLGKAIPRILMTELGA